MNTRSILELVWLLLWTQTMTFMAVIFWLDFKSIRAALRRDNSEVRRLILIPNLRGRGKLFITSIGAWLIGLQAVLTPDPPQVTSSFLNAATIFILFSLMYSVGATLDLLDESRLQRLLRDNKEAPTLQE